jgi:serine/threonine protein kinase
MFRKQDFKKVDLLGSGKKNTKIYKAEHIPTGKYYALKEVEAKTLEKLNEYKVSIFIIKLILMVYRKKQFSYSKCKTTQMYYNFTDIIFMRLCIILTGLQWFANTSTPAPTSNICSERENNKIYFGIRKSWRR